MYFLSILYNVKIYNRYGVGGKYFLFFVLWRLYKNKNKNLFVMWLEVLYFLKSLFIFIIYIDLNLDFC